MISSYGGVHVLTKLPSAIDGVPSSARHWSALTQPPAAEAKSNALQLMHRAKRNKIFVKLLVGFWIATMAALLVLASLSPSN